MLLEDGSRHLRGNGPLSCVFDGLGLALVGNGANDCGALHDLTNGHGNGSLRDGVEIREPALSELLLPASVVQIDRHIRAFGFEIGRRVIEGKVPVFTNSHERNVDDGFFNKGADPPTFRIWIDFAVEKMKGRKRERKFAHEAFPQVLPKGSVMRDREPDVLIEVKTRHLVPRQIRLGQFRQSLELGRAGGYDKGGGTFCFEG